MKLAVEDMIKEFNKISYKRKNCSEIIYKYGYIIHRLISEVQVMLLLMGSASSDGKESKIGKSKIIEAADGNFLSLLPLITFMGLPLMYRDINYTHEKLKYLYIKEVDLLGE